MVATERPDRITVDGSGTAVVEIEKVLRRELENQDAPELDVNR